MTSTDDITSGYADYKIEPDYEVTFATSPEMISIPKSEYEDLQKSKMKLKNAKLKLKIAKLKIEKKNSTWQKRELRRRLNEPAAKYMVCQK